jgi:ATP-binding cassette subfamily B protein
MLRKLLRSHLRPYKNLLLAIVVLQTVQVSAALTLPTINAKIIDNGVLTGDTAYIVKLGGLMVVFSLIQVIFSVGAVYYGGKVAMSFGRDIRKNLFHKVTDLSTREVGAFGAPSLITRITNDVTQVQILVVMVCTMFVAAPITIIAGVFLAVRVDGALSMILLVSIPALVLSVGYVIYRMVPTFQRMQERTDTKRSAVPESGTLDRVDPKLLSPEGCPSPR